MKLVLTFFMVIELLLISTSPLLGLIKVVAIDELSSNKENSHKRSNLFGSLVLEELVYG